MKKYKLVVILLLVTCNLTAQYHEDDDRFIGYGPKAGITCSSISNLETTILSEPYFLNYTLKSHQRTGYTGGFFFNFRFQQKLLAIQSEIAYSQQGGDLLFNNLEKDFNYKMQFHYQYIIGNSMFKVYPLKDKGHFDGINLGAGPQIGLNVAANNIIYTSGGSGRLNAFGTDLDQQQQLRNVLKGKTNFGFLFQLGYEFWKIDLTVDLRYYVGMTDVLTTEANNYNFIENKNTNRSFFFTLGWDLSNFNSN